MMVSDASTGIGPPSASRFCLFRSSHKGGGTNVAFTAPPKLPLRMINLVQLDQLGEYSEIFPSRLAPIPARSVTVSGNPTTSI